MRIERLRIENFRRFKLVDLELGDGVTALVGRNGAGKSSLLEAIGWCLYGNEAARTGKDLIKRRGASPHDDVRVHLAFQFAGQAFDITRELLGKSGAHSATVKAGGKVVVAAGPQSSKEATAYIERLFHMDRAAFFTSIVARQRELAALSSATPSERKRILIGLLRLDAVDAAIQEARARRRDAQKELQTLRSVALDVGAIRRQLDAARAAAEVQRASLVEADARIVALVDEVEELRQRREAGRKLAEENKAIMAETALIDQRLAHIAAERARREPELARVRAAATEAAVLVEQVTALPTARLRVDRLTALSLQHQELARVRAEIARAEQEAASAAAIAEAARHALASAAAHRAEGAQLAAVRPAREADLTAAQKRTSDLDAAAQQAAKRVNDVAGRESKVRAIGPDAACPTCFRPLHEHYDVLLRAFGAEADALRKRLEHLRPERDSARAIEAAARDALVALATRESALRVELDRLVAEESRLAAANARLEEARSRAARLRAQEAPLAAAPFDARELDAARVELRALEAARDRHARLTAEAEREKEIVSILAELEISRGVELAKRAALVSRQQALGFDAPAHDGIERAALAAESRLMEARILRERAVSERVRREEEEKRVAQTLTDQEALAARAAAAQARVLLLEELAGEREGGLLPQFKDHLIGRIRPLLSLHAGRLFRELTEGRYADLEVDPEYDLLVHDEGEPFALARFSGGESDLANLCLRLAVSRVVAERAGTGGVGFLALDEIFGSQDEIRKGNILQALGALSGQFRQILIITHIADVKETADHVLRVEAAEDGTSRVIAEG